ncbi:type I secretion system membrane fusion protein PrsE [bacterium MnTg02]|nr:type I secretion system membrane fusion protein PrsE [bacterium MnTg02]
MNQNTGSAHGIFAEVSYPNRKAGTRKALFLGISVIAITVCGAAYWAATAPLSSAVVAQGQIVVSGKRKQVQHRDGGRVGKINVRDGSIVKAGDVLVELEDKELNLRHSLMRTAYFSALATKARLVAEKDTSEKLEFSEKLVKAEAEYPPIAVMMENQREVFHARRKEKEGQIVVLRQRIAQTKEEILGYQAEKAAALEQTRIAKTEFKLLQKLLADGHTTRTRVVSLERELAQLTGNVGKFRSLVARAHANIGEARLQILQVTKQFRAETLKEMTEIQNRIYDLREKSESTADRIERLRIRAPSSGEVVNMKLSTVGGVIQPGETILEIVPKNERLIIRARIRPVDVDQISVGLETEVRVTAFKQRNTAPLNGRVMLVSADALTDDRSGESYYLAEIRVIDTPETSAIINRLHPGMPAEVMIKTGERTALAYLVQPILDSVNRAMRER